MSDKKRMATGHSRGRTSDQPSRTEKGSLVVIGNRRPVGPERLHALPLKFLRFTTVRDRTGLSRSTIWRLERQGTFPKHRRISANAVGWLELEINEWVLSKVG